MRPFWGLGTAAEVPFEGVSEGLSCLFSGTCEVRSGSQRGLSGVLGRPLRCRFWESLQVFTVFFEGPARPDQGVSEAFSGRRDARYIHVSGSQ